MTLARVSLEVLKTFLFAVLVLSSIDDMLVAHSLADSLICGEKVCKDAVIVEADAIKNHDVIFKVLSDRLGSDPSISTLVHEYSTSAAEDMLVTAINNEKVGDIPAQLSFYLYS